MGIITTVNLISSGVLLALSVLYILYFFLIQKEKIQLLYSSVGVLAAVFIVLVTYLHQEDNLTIHLIWGKYTMVCYLILMQSIFYIIYYINLDRNKIPILSISIISTIVIILILLLGNNFMYSEIQSINLYEIANQNYFYLKGTTSGYYVLSVFCFYGASICFLFYYIIQSKILKSSFRYQLHYWVLILFLVSNIYDVLVDIGIIQSIFISEYAILIIVLLFEFDLLNHLFKQNKEREQVLRINENFNFLIQNVNLYVLGFGDNQKINFINRFSKKHFNVKEEGHFLSDLFSIEDLNLTPNTKDLHIIKTKSQEKIIKFSFISFAVENSTQSYLIGYDITEKVNEQQKLIETLLLLKKLTVQLEEENIDLKVVSAQSSKPNELFVDNFLSSVEQEVKRVANYKSTVLIEGAIGTGKKYIADLLIKESNRAEKPFIVYSCHTSIKSIFKTQYYENNIGVGAFNKGILDVVNNGTLILSDIENMSLEDQDFLLTLLKDKEKDELEYDIRFIVTTTIDLKQKTRDGNFNKELYQYLSLYKIHLPELKNRNSDIPYLVKLFVENYCNKNDIPLLTVSMSTIKKLQSYHWPENIKELRYIIHKAAIGSKGKSLRLKNFDEYKKEKEQQKEQFLTLDDYEKQYILEILKQTSWKISGKKSASEILNINEATLRSKMKKLEIKKMK